MTLFGNRFVPLGEPYSLRPKDIVCVRFDPISKGNVSDLERRRVIWADIFDYRYVGFADYVHSSDINTQNIRL